MSFLTILLSLSVLFGGGQEAFPQDTTISERASRTSVVEFKKDKVIYSATKFMFLPSESLADLLNCLPGVYVYSNGTATVNAATMGSIMINSVPFVPSDKTISLNMISADKVERIEVSGTSINVILKSEAGNSHIAEATFAAGTSFHPKFNEGDSPDFLYRGKFFIKEDGKKSRTALYGIALNSSDTDMGIGVLSNNMSSRTRLSSQGLLTNLKAGLLHEGHIGKNLNTSVNIQYRRTLNNIAKTSVKYYFDAPDKSSNDSAIENESLGDTRESGMNLDMNIENAGSHKYKVRLSPTIRSFRSFLNTISYTGYYSSGNQRITARDVTAKGFDASSALNIDRKKDKAGEFSFYARFSTGNNHDDDLNCFSAYEGDKRVLDSTLFSVSQLDRENSFITTLTHRIDLSKSFKLQTSLGTTLTSSRQKRDINEDIDPELVSAEMSHRFFKGRHSVSLIYSKNNLSFAAGASAFCSKHFTDGNEISLIEFSKEKLKWDVSPTLSLSKTFREGGQFRLSYSGEVSRPLYSQLVTFPDFSDPTGITLGNKNLSTGFNQSFSLDYTKSNPEKGKYFSIRGIFTLKGRSIVPASWNERGHRITTWLNTEKPTFSASIPGYIRIPIGSDKLSLTVNGKISQNVRVGYKLPKGDLSKAEEYSLIDTRGEFYPEFGYNGKWFSLIGYSGVIIYWINSENFMGGKPRQEYSTGFTSSFRTRHSWGMRLNTEYTLYKGYSGPGNDPFFNMGLLLSKSFRKLDITLQISDILGSVKRQWNVVNEEYEEFTWTATLGRFALLSFRYNF